LKSFVFFCEQNYSLDYVYDWTVKQEQGSTPARNPGGALPHNGRERERDEANTREASTRNPKLETRKPQPETPNTKHQTSIPNPKP
jgi:hypothetical protein